MFQQLGHAKLQEDHTHGEAAGPQALWFDRFLPDIGKLLFVFHL